MAAGIAGAVQAGRAIEGIDHQAGIVGQGRQAGFAAGVSGLDQGILDEGGRGFVGIDHTEFRLCQQLDIEIGEQCPQFGEFAAVAAGEYQFHRVLVGFGSIRSQRLPYRSANTTTVP